MIRPFDWRDLSVLHKYRNQGLCLNTALGLTHGQAISPRVLLSYLNPASGFFTWIMVDDKTPLIGQLNHPTDTLIGRISFLAPEKAIKNSKPQLLLEQLAKQAGQRGAFHLIAEIDELAPSYEVLRRAGFGIYARQRIWKIPGTPDTEDCYPQWYQIKYGNSIQVQTLIHNVVPGLVGQVEGLPRKQLEGLVCENKGDVIGYVDFKYGYFGIWAQPFIHPDVENIDGILRSMINSIPDRRSRPIYLCVRTYQSWLEPAIGELDSQSSPLQAVMVKRLAARQKLALQALPNIDGQTEFQAPIVHSQNLK